MSKSTTCFPTPLGVVRSPYARRIVLATLGVVTVVVLLYNSLEAVRVANIAPPLADRIPRDGGQKVLSTSHDDEEEPFRRYTLWGYDNIALDTEDHARTTSSYPSCDALRHTSEIGVQKSWHMQDNLWEIATALDDHPLVTYSHYQVSERFHLDKLIRDSWDRLATACVLMPEQDVYLCVTRIMFHAETWDRSRISFLRGQIFSKDWTHLDRYHLMWEGQVIEFPRIFDVPIPYHVDEAFQGPEDARIILEHGVEGAEPVIVFNMISPESNGSRQMWIFRPFTLHTKMLSFHGMPRSKKEKNWAPFFLVDESSLTTTTSSIRRPNNCVHFVYSFGPLEIVKCSLVDGDCDVVFTQEDSSDIKKGQGALQGGTPFVPVPLNLLANKREQESDLYSYHSLQAFVALSRTHVAPIMHCFGGIYRPEIIVMVTDGKNFALTYGSEPIDFGPGIVMNDTEIEEICDSGRILIANGIASWKYDAEVKNQRMDVMTVQVSVNDKTAQSLQLQGVLELIKNLASTRRLIANPSTFFTPRSGKQTQDEYKTGSEGTGQSSQDLMFLNTSKIRECVEESARQYRDEKGREQKRKFDEVERLREEDFAADAARREAKKSRFEADKQLMREERQRLEVELTETQQRLAATNRGDQKVGRMMGDSDRAGGSEARGRGRFRDLEGKGKEQGTATLDRPNADWTETRAAGQPTYTD